MKWLYPFIGLMPVAIAGHYLHWPAMAIFATSAVAIVPLSALLGRATEELAGHVGPTIGGFPECHAGKSGRADHRVTRAAGRTDRPGHVVDHRVHSRQPPSCSRGVCVRRRPQVSHPEIRS